MRTRSLACLGLLLSLMLVSLSKFEWEVARWVLLFSVLAALATVWAMVGASELARRVQQQEQALTSYRQQDSKVAELLQIVTQAGVGNLTGRPSFSGDDPLGLLARGLQDMLEDFSGLARRLQKLGIELSSSTYAIATQSGAQEKVAGDQVHTVAQVLKNSQIMDAVSQDLVSTICQVSEVTEGTARAAEECHQRYQKLKEILVEVLTASSAVIGRLTNLGTKTDDINHVVTSFAVVAHDTNLLYINAAIAAEKAGEFGQGFHAVAQEIRRMADRNSVSAIEIERNVEELQAAVKIGGRQMQDFVGKIEHDATSLVELGAQLVEVGFQVQGLRPRFEEAVREVEAQSRSAHEIAKQIQKVSEGVQQSAQALRTSGEALSRVHSVANELKSVLAEFVVD